MSLRRTLRLPAPFRRALYLHASVQHSRWLLCSSLHTHSLSQEAVLDGRARLSRFWIPTGGIAPNAEEDSHGKLLRAGFLRQAYPGVFHLLPLGRRVLNKLEAFIDRHMYQIGASKVELSSISSEELWSKSGRLQSAGSELFHFQDRKKVPYLLSPTHEEEITSLVSTTVKSYRELPILLYQTSRKYRDELRPRHGLLRSREFVMKDLYTFDISPSHALSTYYRVRDAYVELFNELKLPFMVAEADSGDIGGNLSHEFHFPTAKGEDHVISCSSCNYVANEELAESVSRSPTSSTESESISHEEKIMNQMQVWRGVSKDRLTLINVWYSATSISTDTEINTHAVKAILPEVDTSVEDPTPYWKDLPLAGAKQPRAIKVVNLVDGRLPPSVVTELQELNPPIPLLPEFSCLPHDVAQKFLTHAPSNGLLLNMLRVKQGDSCPRCKTGALKVERAIELGHTFHLGSRYSEPMGAGISVPFDVLENSKSANDSSAIVTGSPDQRVPFQMGCHGIGVSRIIGAVAETLADERGLNWPRIMAPFDAVIIPIKGLEDAAVEVYDILSTNNAILGKSGIIPDLILDDRDQSFPWKIQDADLVGYPVIIIVGRNWKGQKMCEIQCRRLKIRQDVPIFEVSGFIGSLLERL